jgi:hypothetical protein
MNDIRYALNCIESNLLIFDNYEIVDVYVSELFIDEFVTNGLHFYLRDGYRINFIIDYNIKGLDYSFKPIENEYTSFNELFDHENNG